MRSGGSTGPPASTWTSPISTAARSGPPPAAGTGSGSPTSWAPGTTSSAAPAVSDAGGASCGARWASTSPRRSRRCGRKRRAPRRRIPLAEGGAHMSGVTAAELGGHAFLRGMADHHLATLARACWVAPLRAGHRLFEEGGTAHRFWLLQSGHVALDLHSPGAPAGSSSRRWAPVIWSACPGSSRPTNGSSARQPSRTP